MWIHITLFIIEFLIAIGLFLTYRIYLYCTERFSHGEVYVTICSRKEIIRGWVRERDLVNILNSNKTIYEYIRVSTKSESVVVVVGEIQTIKRETNIFKLMIGNLV